MKDYIFGLALGFLDYFKFVKTMESLKKRFIILQFMIVTLILYLPLFYSVVKIAPYELYFRLYSISFDTELKLSDFGIDLEMLKRNEENVLNPSEDTPGILLRNTLTEAELDALGEELIEEDASRQEIWFCFTKEYIIIKAGNNKLAVLSDYYTNERVMSVTFGTLFNDIAVNNQYYTALLIPALGMVLAVLMVLQLFFYLMLSLMLGTYRMTSSKLSFGLRFKLLIMVSGVPALISMLIGFVIPAVHIIIFELAAIAFSMFVSKKYDKKEKELFLCEE